MRSQGGYAWCDECNSLFSSKPSDKAGTITHPTFADVESPVLIERFRKCSSAGKTFAHPLMEEVTEGINAQENRSRSDGDYGPPRA